MLIKKFEAESFEQALGLVKTELGTGALVLSTQTKRLRWYSRPTVEVTAAVEEKGVKQQETLDETSLENIFPHRRQEKLDRQESKMAIPRSVLNRYMELSDQEGSNTPAEERAVPRPRLNPIRDSLLPGFSQESANEIEGLLSKQYSGSDLQAEHQRTKAVSQIVGSRLQTLGPAVFSAGTFWTAVGGPGCGKTSFTVKLAHYLQSRQHSVDLVSHDSRKVVGRAELAAYARLLKLPVVDASSKTAPDPGRTHLADTPSCSWRRPAEWEKLRQFCGQANVFVVLDATQRVAESVQTLQAAANLRPKAIAFTRVDLVTEFGALYEILSRSGLPLMAVSISSSFKVPVTFFAPERLGHFLVSSAVRGRRSRGPAF